MPKYYCDYCDTYLTHDSPSVRKTHCSGRKHKENVRIYYQKWLEEQVQKLVDDTTAAFTQGKLPNHPFPGPAPGAIPGNAMIPPPAALGGPPGVPPGAPGMPPPGMPGAPRMPPPLMGLGGPPARPMPGVPGAPGQLPPRPPMMGGPPPYQ